MLFYRAALPLSSQTLDYTTGVIRRHRRKIGSPWRKLSPGAGPAGPGLPPQRRDVRRARRGVRHRHRHGLALRDDPVALLAARSPKLNRALASAKKAGHAYVVIDGTLIPIDRVAADRPFYSGKHRRHGMSLQVISAPDGEILWVSGPLPGAVHDLTAARIWGILRELAASGLVVLADKGYAGAGEHVRIPYRGRGKPGREGRQPRARPATQPGRTRRRPAQDLAHPAQTPLLPLESRAARRSHPRPSNPRDRRMKKAQCLRYRWPGGHRPVELAPQNAPHGAHAHRFLIRIMYLTWVELSGLEPLTSCMP